MQIETGIVKEPHFVLIYGTPGIGKTTFISEAPKPIILDLEGGSRKYNVARNTSIKSFQELMSAIAWLRKEKHEFQTVGIDSLDHVEPLVFDHTAKVDGKSNIEDVGGGFQKGYGYAIEYWRQMIAALKDLRSNRNMNVVLIAHAKVVTVNDPMQAIPYDRYTLKLHENKQCSASALWREAVEACLFAAYEDTVFKVDKKDKRGKTSGDGVRKLYTTRTPAWDAKNRLGLPRELPFSLGQSWATFAMAADAGQPESFENLVADLTDLTPLMKEKVGEEMFNRFCKAFEDAKTEKNLVKLTGIRNHARVLTGDV